MWGRIFSMVTALVAVGCAQPNADVPLVTGPEGGRVAATVFLAASGPEGALSRYDLPWLGAGETVVSFASRETTNLRATLRCDGPGRVIPARAERGDAGLNLRAGASRELLLPPDRVLKPRERVQLVLAAETTRCTLTWGDGQALDLVRENIGDPVVAALDARADACASAPAGDPLRAEFLAERPLLQTCARPLGSVQLMADEAEALRLRLEQLTGSRIDPAVLAKGDPDMPLDFTNAPVFDQIVISYLQFRADISGYLIARALSVHAARGTKIRIAVAAPLVLDLDRNLFETMAAKFPNVQVQEVRWQPAGPKLPGDDFVAAQRSNHVKLFAALSRSPGASFAIVGGRNLNDMFFYPTLQDRQTRPFLHDYSADDSLAAKLNPIKYFNANKDFEVALFDRVAVEDLMAQFGKFWNRDLDGAILARGMDETGVPAVAANDGLVRHFLSVPYSDGRAQIDLYVDLIDAARETILASSPFNYPPPEIEAALVRAADRGVDITMVTRPGADEPASSVVNLLNLAYAERYRDRFRIATFKPEEEGVLVHTKLLVIDDRLSVVASTNLNRRSFEHDTENGFLFYDRGVAAGLRGLIEDYVARGEAMPENERMRRLGEILMGYPGLMTFF